MSWLRRASTYSVVQLVLELAGFVILGLLLSSVFRPDNSIPGLLPFLAALALLGVGWFLLAVRLLEHRSAADVGLPRQNLVRDLLLGFLFGACLMASVIGTMALTGWYRVTGLSLNWPLLLAALAMFFAVAVWEEVVFRGIAFRLLERMIGSWVALVVSAVIFGATHLLNPHATLVSTLAIAATGGLLLAGVYMVSRSLWAVFGVHWAWDFFQGPVFGTQVSGIDQPLLLRSVTKGPEAWTGGSFGPEAGLVSILLVGGVAVVVLVVAARRGRVVAPGWSRRMLPASAST